MSDKEKQEPVDTSKNDTQPPEKAESVSNKDEDKGKELEKNDPLNKKKNLNEDTEDEELSPSDSALIAEYRRNIALLTMQLNTQIAAATARHNMLNQQIQQMMQQNLGNYSPAQQSPTSQTQTNKGMQQGQGVSIPQQKQQPEANNTSKLQALIQSQQAEIAKIKQDFNEQIAGEMHKINLLENKVNAKTNAPKNNELRKEIVDITFDAIKVRIAAMSQAIKAENAKPGQFENLAKQIKKDIDELTQPLKLTPQAVQAKEGLDNFTQKIINGGNPNFSELGQAVNDFQNLRQELTKMSGSSSSTTPTEPKNYQGPAFKLD